MQALAIDFICPNAGFRIVSAVICGLLLPHDVQVGLRRAAQDYLTSCANYIGGIVVRITPVHFQASLSKPAIESLLNLIYLDNIENSSNLLRSRRSY
jgi:hypothetical protein